MPTEPGPPADHWSETCDEMARRAQAVLMETRLHVVLTREAILKSRELVQAVRSARNVDGAAEGTGAPDPPRPGRARARGRPRPG